MTSINLDFANKHNLTAMPADVTRTRGPLESFYRLVEGVAPVGDYYIQLYLGETVRSALTRQDALWGAFGAALAMAEMPAAWPTKYRASVAYHLGPLLDDVINS